MEGILKFFILIDVSFLLSFFACSFLSSAIASTLALTYLCSTWFRVFPHEHFLALDLYTCQQYPQQYDSIVSPKLTNCLFLPLKE